MELFEQIKKGERSLLVDAQFFDPSDQTDSDINELKALVAAAGWQVVTTIHTKRSRPDPKYFVGSGKVDEISSIIKSDDIHLVIFNHNITPAQERNLTKMLPECRIVDRTRVVLDIFALRARTYEGRLQVELAQLNYQATRLVRAWTHLERQKGGIGLRGGPGEKQIELDRRMIRNRIRTLEEKIDKVRSQRALSRSVRKKSHIPTVSLVGYTNAGKSTLFNAITGADAFVKDQLFATLDTTLRKSSLAFYGEVIFSDTVGFIRNLPHDLVDAFRATLEETAQADLLLHVVDQSDEHYRSYIHQVKQVLKEIDADHVPILEVYNKIDLADATKVVPHVDYDQEKLVPRRVWCSAQSGLGIDLLKEAISLCLSKDEVSGKIVIEAKYARLRAQLYQIGAVVSEDTDENGNIMLNIRCRFYKLKSICDDNALELGDIFYQH
ncbi:GTPase HflX [Thiotrichales bacterium 19S3-7]|nr:GTPase HflX [Thiotrichales bacterium 19S3-7]MCF6801904.1 GTPase HflX [Thiotrichales bacterium 19S3-11]